MSRTANRLRLSCVSWEDYSRLLRAFAEQAGVRVAYDRGALEVFGPSTEFRTAPLWRVSERRRFLHDGRAATILDAIRIHGGQAAAAVAAFNALSARDRQALLDFLSGI